MDWKEARRRRAYELRRAGWTYEEIAEALGISKGAVSQWITAATHGGTDALRARPRAGVAPRLSAKQLALLPDLLSHGAEAYGFRGEVWTCARVAAVIREEFGVRYHKAHVSRLLKALHWTPQLPIERAIQRDEQDIQRWRVDVWPLLKKKPAGRAG
jgi:transposase